MNDSIWKSLQGNMLQLNQTTSNTDVKHSVSDAVFVARLLADFFCGVSVKLHLITCARGLIVCSSRDLKLGLPLVPTLAIETVVTFSDLQISMDKSGCIHQYYSRGGLLVV